MALNDKDNLKGTCQEFVVRFTNEQSEQADPDVILKLHAEALTKCVKLLTLEPDAESVLRLWKVTIRLTTKVLLSLSKPASNDGLRVFSEILRPWVIDGKFRGSEHEVIHSLYKLSLSGPWSHPLLQDMFQKKSTPEQLKEIFDTESHLTVHRLCALQIACKFDEFILYSHAAMLHPKACGDKLFHSFYQTFCVRHFNYEQLAEEFKYFDFKVTCQVIDALESSERKLARKLCKAAAEYMWAHNIIDALPEMSFKWCKVLSERYGLNGLYDVIMVKVIRGPKALRSVEQCVSLASALRKLDAVQSRTTCVEVLVHALHVLAPDDPNNELLKSGILSSIAYFLPNSQIARSCSLTIFFSDPSRDHYFELSNMYKVEYDRDNDPSLNCKAQLRLQLLDYLHQQWPPEFASCETWGWMILHEACLEYMAPDDSAYVRQVEREEAERKNADSAEESLSEETVTSQSEEGISLENEDPGLVGNTPVSISTEAIVEEHVEVSDDLTVQDTGQNSNVVEGVGPCVHGVMGVHGSVGVHGTHGVDVGSVSGDSPAVITCGKVLEDLPVEAEISAPKFDSTDHDWSVIGSMGVEDTLVDIEKSNLSIKSTLVEQFEANRMGVENTLVENQVAQLEVKNTLVQVHEEQLINKNKKLDLNELDTENMCEDKLVAPLSAENTLDEISKAPLVKENTLDEIDPSQDTIEDIGTNAQFIEGYGHPHSNRRGRSCKNKGKPPTPLQPHPTWVCPVESCQRVFNSKKGMSIHLNKKHSWSPQEVSVFYNSLTKQTTSKSVRNSRSNIQQPHYNQPGCSDIGRDIQSEIPTENDVIINSPKNFNDHLKNTTNGIDSEKFERRYPTPIPSLPDIFPTIKAVVPEVSKPSDSVSTPPTSILELKCPVKYCDRVFRHKHTIQAHLEFRHRFKSKTAAEMSEKAEIVEKVPPPPNKRSSRPNKVDISKSQGWYWPVDEFLFQEFNEVVIQDSAYSRKKFSNLKASITRDVMCLFGSAPLSFDLTLAHKYLEEKWKISTKLPTSEPQSEPTIAPVDKLVTDPPVFVKDTPQVDQPAPKTRLAYKPLLNMKVKVKKSAPKIIPPPDPPNPAPNLLKPRQEPSNTNGNHKSVSSQTTFHPPAAIFTPEHHFHNIKSPTGPPDPGASQTIVSPGVFGVSSRTYAVQCCDTDPPPFKSPRKRKTSTPHKPPLPLKAPTPHKPLTPIKPPTPKDLPTTTDPPSKSKIKRKYDAQTVYFMADRCKTADDAPTTPHETTSFADALRCFTPNVLVEAERKIKRRLSNSKDGKEKVEKPDTKKDPSPANPPDINLLKKSLKKRRSVSISKSSDGSPKTSLFLSEPVTSIKPRLGEDLDILSHRAGYQELLKKAEEITQTNSSTQKVKSDKKTLTISPKEIVESPKATMSSGKKKKRTFSNVSSGGEVKESVGASPNKKTSGSKRTIDLRKLSSHSSSSGKTTESPTESDTPTTRGGDISEPTEIKCPECNRVMVDSFALTCHMRKKHKQNSRKLFIPKSPPKKQAKKLV